LREVKQTTTMKKNNLWKFIVCTSITSFAYNKKESIGFIFFDFYLAYTEEFEDT